MFQFIKNLFGFGKPKLPKIPTHLKELAVMFENGNHGEVAMFLKKNKIPSDAKILKTINPHFEDYFGELRFDYGKALQHPTCSHFSGTKHFNTSYNDKTAQRIFVTPLFLKNLILDYRTNVGKCLFGGRNLYQDQKWSNDTKNTIIKKNPNTKIYCFTNIHKPLVDCNFDLLKIPQIDEIHIWLEPYSFYYNDDWFENQTVENLKKLPNKKLVFGCNHKKPFVNLINNLKAIGYNVTILDNFDAEWKFFNPTEVKLYKEYKIG